MNARRVLGALLLFTAASASRLAGQTVYEELQTFSGVLNHIRVNYVDSVDTGALVRAAIRGMLRSLDPHSRYQTREDFLQEQQAEAGKLAGVGVWLEMVENAPTVLNLVPDGPAEKAGILPGDRLVALNDTSVAGVELSALEGRMWGEKGSRIRLRIERGSRLEPDTFSVTIKRGFLQYQVVPPPRLAAPGVGYVRLEEFSPGSPDELAAALKTLHGMKARTVILDLRGNPGGYVRAMAQIASELLPAHSLILRTRARRPGMNDSLVTEGKGKFRDLPLLILVDENSASASEMLTGCLQDHDRALVLGRRTFGKGLQQTALPLPGGDIVWLTTARIVTPAGRIIQRRYTGLEAGQYYSLAGEGGAPEDTLAVYHTDHGRTVRGGGGVLPDVILPARTVPPGWWSVAMDSGFVTQVADSVALTLKPGTAALARWTATAQDWRVRLTAPFLALVRRRLNLRGTPDSAVTARIGRSLAYRAVLVRWGADAAAEFRLRTDPDIAAAVSHVPDLERLLGP